MSAHLPLSSQHQQSFVPIDMPLTYLHLHPAEKKPLLILFHGYSDTAAGFLRRAFSTPSEDYEILAPNGLFPVPVKIENGWKRTFAWYFADYTKREVLIPPTVAAQAVAGLINNLGLAERPKVLLGFSQGGFFLPFIFPLLKNVKKMFSIGAAYRVEDYPLSLSVPLDAFHGDKDKIIGFERAQESFGQLKSINPEGQFHLFQGLGHTMNDESRALLKRKVDDVFRSTFQKDHP